MRHIPWMTLVMGAVFFVTPLGQSIIQGAFFSGERLSNSISQFILLCVTGIIVAAAAVEWGIKAYLRRRRSRPAA